jgi:general nucleoside transport system ATP-binding protein
VAMTDEEPIVVLEEITKAYPGVLANDEVTLDLFPEEIHTILGENGAGKTTLMGILSGLHRPDAGRIVLRGEEVSFQSAREALAHGIGYVQQHFSLIPTLTVAQNAVLALRAGGVRISLAATADRMGALARRYGFDIEQNVPIEDLGVGDQQRAEILKALIREPSVLILDEPSALLTPQEAGELASLLRTLASEGVAIFLISHKLEEVLSVSDRVSVLRRGRLVETLRASAATKERLAELMIGELRTPDRSTRGRDKAAGDVRLRVEGLWVKGDRGSDAVQGVSFEVRAGEILGIAGIEGSGQVELTEALAGMRKATRGTVVIDGRRLDRSGREETVAHVPADRLRSGLVRSLSVEENLVLPVADKEPFSRFGLLRRGAIRERARGLIRRFDIRVHRPDLLAAALSGGNQQKMVLARELAGRPGVIVCCYPARGLDFAATESVQHEIASRRADGTAIVYASVDLDELLELTDRIIVLHRGRMTGEVTTSEATAEQLGLMMTGADAA